MTNLRVPVVLGLLAGLLPGIAAAQSDTGEDEDAEARADARPYFGIAFLGGVLVPTGDMADTHQQSLAAGVRVGWIGSHGIGLDLESEYSPLSRTGVAAGESFETHFATAAVMPRLQLGKRTFRLWASAGAGVAYERTRHLMDATVLDTDSGAAPLAIGAAGLELHPISGVGLAITSRYARAFGELGHQFLNVTGGLVFTFR